MIARNASELPVCKARLMSAATQHIESREL